MSRLVILTEIISPYRIPAFNALAKHEDIDLHVIFLAENDPTLRQWLVYKHEIGFSYEVLPSWRTRLGEYNVLLNRGLDAALHRAAPEAIVCGGYNYLASWECLRWAKRNEVPFLLWIESTSHDMRGRQAVVERLKSKFMRECDGFVVPGKSSSEYVCRFGVSENRIFVAPNAVDTELFAREAEIAREQATSVRLELAVPLRYFLFVGRLVREKGVFDLLTAYRSLAPQIREQVGLVFVGDGPARLELSAQAATIQPGVVQLKGFVQRERLASYYALAEAFVFPTCSDPWGLVVNEAMACGLPVVCSAVAGCAADLIEDNWNGRVVRTGDVEQITHAMEQLGTNAELRLLMGQRSRERIHTYSPEACARGFAEAVLSCGALCHE